ncbi:helix-hairpin-helix domain-containing protein [Halalkalibacter akibai]|uniref:Late competence protein n=1 Tax=Halalkalibacter akibai (strain ATCC 43226 / DSM 21942 / CIP 109018 / JCM 9157 / 1139) TaxID=1236973 RepID=W4QN55_HALA3|nr:helix-hairpin-helix domain-containing protein [Halalkalibacter akibai]GAE33342.1 late competence protein [Halalkalibacter akibai JCM 9157]
MKIMQNQILLVVIVILIVGVLVFFQLDNGEEEAVEDLFEQFNSADEDKETEEIREEEKKVVIDVKGAVAEPGVYELRVGNRIHHAISRAGGLLQDADEKKLNLALLLQDEMVVYVPTLGEEGMDIQIGIPTSSQNQEGKIAINHADSKELEQLPGIGPAKASAIIAYREENGPFKEVNDLLKVSGIGPKSIEKLGEFLIFNLMIIGRFVH